MSEELVQVYSLERDRQIVEHVQMESVKGTRFGLRKDHGLFGSKQWWEAIRSGAIETRRSEGRISRIYKNAQDWPEFEIETANGRASWSLDGDAQRYVVGKRARVDYVMQAYQQPQQGGEQETQVVIGIWVEP